MKPEIRKKWTTALRSEDYPQGDGKLRNEESYCCLGVLCDLAAKEGIGEWRGDHFFVTGSDQEASAFLHPAVVEWAGLVHVSPKIKGVPLTAYNDGDEGEEEAYSVRIAPHSFAEIADLIDAHL